MKSATCWSRSAEIHSSLGLTAVKKKPAKRRRNYLVWYEDLRRVTNLAVQAAKRDGREIVGLIVDNGLYLELIDCQNKLRRGGGFAFYYPEVRRNVRAAELLGHEVVGTFHSHPVGLAEPGDGDIASAVRPSQLMLIIDCMTRKVALWRIKDGNARKLVLRAFSTRSIRIEPDPDPDRSKVPG